MRHPCPAISGACQPHRRDLRPSLQAPSPEEAEGRSLAVPAIVKEESKSERARRREAADWVSASPMAAEASAEEDARVADLITRMMRWRCARCQSGKVDMVVTSRGRVMPWRAAHP
jgi:hypothetical protein